MLLKHGTSVEILHQNDILPADPDEDRVIRQLNVLSIGLSLHLLSYISDNNVRLHCLLIY